MLDGSLTGSPYIKNDPKMFGAGVTEDSKFSMVSEYFPTSLQGYLDSLQRQIFEYVKNDLLTVKTAAWGDQGVLRGLYFSLFLAGRPKGFGADVRRKNTRSIMAHSHNRFSSRLA